MASNAIKRILKKDIKSIQTQKLNELGIYVEFNESNMLEAAAMILGPPDSVYHNGILFFKIVFPHNYPYSPPKVHYISRGSLRIHPNLYTGTARDNYLGKVCLSILGTWSGPKWSTIMDISSVLISIQSLLDMNPLDHEPGFTGKTSEVHENYRECVSYERFRTLIYRNIFDIPEPFVVFKSIIQQHYESKKQEILDEIQTRILSGINKETLYIPIYRIRCKLDYTAVKQMIEVKELTSA